MEVWAWCMYFHCHCHVSICCYFYSFSMKYQTLFQVHTSTKSTCEYPSDPCYFSRYIYKVWGSKLESVVDIRRGCKIYNKQWQPHKTVDLERDNEALAEEKRVTHHSPGWGFKTSFKTNRDNHKLLRQKVQRCLKQRRSPSCTLQISSSLSILSIVRDVQCKIWIDM